MNVFLGYKIERGKALLVDLSSFVRKNVTEESRKAFEESVVNLESAKKNKAAKIAVIILLIISLPVVIGDILFELSNMTIADAFELYPIVTYIVLILNIVYFALLIYVFLKSKRIDKSEEYLKLKATKQRMQNLCYESMDVPSLADDLDLFLVQYEQKNGDIRILGTGNVLRYKAYAENGELCLANEVVALGVPFDSLKSISKIKKKMSFGKWEREEPYRKFGVRKGQYDYYVSCYYSLKIELDGEEFELYFPPYELETIEKLTGLKAE